MKYYCRVLQFPSDFPVTKELLNTQNNVSLVMRPWAGTVIVPPLVIRCEHYLLDNNLNNFTSIPSNIVSPIPPWSDVDGYFFANFAGGLPLRELSDAQACRSFLLLLTRDTSTLIRYSLTARE